MYKTPSPPAGPGEGHLYALGLCAAHPGVGSEAPGVSPRSRWQSWSTPSGSRSWPSGSSDPRLRRPSACTGPNVPREGPPAAGEGAGGEGGLESEVAGCEVSRRAWHSALWQLQSRGQVSSVCRGWGGHKAGWSLERVTLPPHMHTYACMQAHACTRVHARVRTCTLMHVCAHARKHTCACAHAHTHIC